MHSRDPGSRCWAAIRVFPPHLHILQHLGAVGTGGAMTSAARSSRCTRCWRVALVLAPADRRRRPSTGLRRRPLLLVSSRLSAISMTGSRTTSLSPSTSWRNSVMNLRKSLFSRVRDRVTGTQRDVPDPGHAQSVSRTSILRDAPDAEPADGAGSARSFVPARSSHRRYKALHDALTRGSRLPLLSVAKLSKPKRPSASVTGSRLRLPRL